MGGGSIVETIHDASAEILCMDRLKFEVSLPSELRMAREAVQTAISMSPRLAAPVMVLLVDAAGRLDRLCVEAEVIYRESQDRRAQARLCSVPAALKKLRSFRRRR
jgi:hypothetical protein